MEQQQGKALKYKLRAEQKIAFMQFKFDVLNEEGEVIQEAVGIEWLKEYEPPTGMVNVVSVFVGSISSAKETKERGVRIVEVKLGTKEECINFIVRVNEGYGVDGCIWGIHIDRQLALVNAWFIRLGVPMTIPNPSKFDPNGVRIVRASPYFCRTENPFCPVVVRWKSQNRTCDISEAVRYFGAIPRFEYSIFSVLQLLGGLMYPEQQYNEYCKVNTPLTENPSDVKEIEIVRYIAWVYEKYTFGETDIKIKSFYMK